jgi:cytochrome c-type biogenesis protein CcmH|tara:strand:+ start:648 stop:1874 length:1227 start_codon:yes stop_codon:yes gene_type:complete
MIFWIVVAALLLVGLACVILPVLSAPKDMLSTDRQQQNINIARDKKNGLDDQLSDASLTQAEYDNALVELQTSLALDLEKSELGKVNQKGKWVLWVLALALPMASIGLYFKVGEYQVIENPALAAIAQPNNQTPQIDMTLDQMVEVVRERLQKNPDDARGWFVLGKTMMEKGNFDQAVTAFQRTLDLTGDQESHVLFSLADALSMKNDGLMMGEPEAIIQQGLKVSPQDPTGLWLAGLAAEQRQDYKASFGYMVTLLPLVANSADSTSEVKRFIALLKDQDPTLVLLAKESIQNPSVKISVSLADQFKTQVVSDNVVFIYAKAASGPPMPLAVKRLAVSDLPVMVELSDADAMMPSMMLSSFEDIIIGARVSKSGNPVAQPGDLYIETGTIDRNALTNEVTLSISKTK